MDQVRNALKNLTANTIGALQGAGEDTVADRTMVMQKFSPFRLTADGQVKGAAGFIHAVEIAPLTATPTAGLLTIYDSLTETGTILYSEWVFATTPGHSIILDKSFGTACYIGFDGTLANVQISGSYL